MPVARPRWTYADYLAAERETDRKHEYLDGDFWMMAGGTPRHSRIISNVNALAFNALGDGPCQPYTSDLKVRVEDTGLATYPDLSIICGPLSRHPEDANAVTNPTVIVEVLSESTEAWDRGEKFAHYRRIPSLRHYVLVAQDRRRVEHFSRDEDGRWTFEEVAPEGAVSLAAVGIELPVEALYRNLPEEAEVKDPPAEATAP